MVKQEDGGEEERGEVCAPEEDVELQPREVEGEQRHQRKDELGQDGPRDLAGVIFLYDIHIPHRLLGFKRVERSKIRQFIRR